MNVRLLLAFLLLAAFFLPLRAADLVTREGKVYHDYTVVGHDDGFLTILFTDGGARVLLKDLPDELQKQYGYDAAKAAAFVANFNATDEQQVAAVDQARADSAAAAAQLKQQAQAANNTSDEDSPTTPAPSVAAASQTDPDSPDDSVPPLSPDAQAAQAAAPDDDAGSGYIDPGYTGLVITDDGGDGYWFTYNDRYGTRHRDFHARGKTHLGSGQWTTTTDPQGTHHREFRQTHTHTATSSPNNSPRPVASTRPTTPPTSGARAVTSSPAPAPRVVNAPPTGGSYRPAASPSYTPAAPTPAARPSFGGAGR